MCLRECSSNYVSDVIRKSTKNTLRTDKIETAREYIERIIFRGSTWLILKCSARIRANENGQIELKYYCFGKRTNLAEMVSGFQHNSIDNDAPPNFLMY